MNIFLLFTFFLTSNCYTVNFNNPKMLEFNKLHFKKVSLKVTKVVSSALAGADHTGHNVLHANSQMIHRILDSDFLSFATRKNLALICIKFAQFGDHTGHNILSSFHHFVDKFL
jgi:hypothetical protein